MSWVPAEVLPSKIDADAIKKLISRFDDALEPASPQQFAVQIDRLFRRARLWRIDLPQQARDRGGNPVGPSPIAEMTEDYRADLGHLPTDLLERAITWACQHWRNGFRLPMPSELLEAVGPDLAKRKRDRMKLGVAAMRAQAKPRDRSSVADQAAATEAFAAMRAALSTAPIRAMGRRADDDRVPADPVEAARRGRATLTGLTLEQRVARAVGD